MAEQPNAAVRDLIAGAAEALDYFSEDELEEYAAERNMKKKPKPEKVRIYFKPARAPKWWPRDAKGKPVYVGITNNGYGWNVGDGDKFNAKDIKAVQENIMFDFGPNTKFRVETV